MDDVFASLIGRARSGDATATEELFHRYEPAVRIEIRMSLRFRSPNLRRVFDSGDVCQSVLTSFFVRLVVGQFDLDRPDQLLALLRQMARNKLTDQIKYQYRTRRDVRLTEPISVAEIGVPARLAGPSRTVAARELLSAVMDRLSDEERRVMDMRAERRGWQEVAAALGGTAEGRRKQFHRAVNRVAADLGLPPADPIGTADPS